MTNNGSNSRDPNTVETSRIAETAQYVLDSTVGNVSHATANERFQNAVDYVSTTLRGTSGGSETRRGYASEGSKANADGISDEQVEDFLRDQYRSVKRSAG